MAMASILENYSIEKLAASSSKYERESRFAGFIFLGVGIAIILFAIFLFSTNSIPRAPWKYVELIGVPVLYFYIAWLYFHSVRKVSSADWTLAARIESEKKKLARQIVLCRKMPTHMVLPIFIIVMVGIIPDFFSNTSDSDLLKTLAMLVLFAVFLATMVWRIRCNVKNNLQPMLDKLSQLEDQLKNS